MDDADRSAVLAVRPPSFMVMAQRLVVHGLTNPGIEGWPGVTPGKGWSSVYCARKIAYGCGRQGQKLVEGLSLYVRCAGRPDLNSALSICLSGEAVRCAKEELGGPGKLEVDGRIRIAHQGILVVLVGFLYRLHKESVYYLVYDSTDASLYVVPYLPGKLEAIYTATPVPVRSAGCRGHELAMLARMRWPCRINRGRLCLSTPALREDSNPWEIKLQQFPREELPQPFSADVLFSIEGKVFWADLSQGIVYSDLGVRGDAVESHCVLLPTEFQIEYPDSPDPYGLAPPMKMPKVSRTMGSVDGSIKFVCINSSDGMVKVLTLDLDSHRWEDEKGFPCPWIELWEQLVSADAELRNLEPPEPQYPVLMPNGALCLLLCDAVQGHKDANYLVQRRKEEVNYICSFDMRTRSLLTLGRVQDYETTGPVILPSDFFRKINTPLRNKKTET